MLRNTLTADENRVFDALWHACKQHRVEVGPPESRYAVTGDIVRQMAVEVVAAFRNKPEGENTMDMGELFTVPFEVRPHEAGYGSFIVGLWSRGRRFGFTTLADLMDFLDKHARAHQAHGPEPGEADPTNNAAPGFRE